ncbi:hypothetical protein [Algoriphagus sp. AK58]|uniref:hypothetical protein n=1 Tax=Algoriphagus sp. AK58 TaxID=1406877 RepID=UPI001650BF6A|nr:hypothetical protein [Algoriphagus sp. AK58]MBC6369015.1 hypothetical protein [Algoriphagus sp. AK58]
MKMNKSGFFWKFRVWFYYKRQEYNRKLLLKRVIKFSRTKQGNVYYDEGKYLQRNGLKIFPYNFEKKYRVEDINLYYMNQYPYFVYLGKHLFLPKEFDEQKSMKYSNQILLEQDDYSPHKYMSSLFTIDRNDVIVDIGCGDGNFSLEHIETVREAFLFEIDQKWKKPLELTFNPWKEKVHISFVSLEKGSNSVESTLMSSLELKNIIFKIDVDGAERKILSLLDTLFPKLGSIKVAICTYHQANDAEDFEKWFIDRGFRTEFSDNYMLFYYDKSIKEPFFRRGILFAVKP